ncbi:MAG: HAMP domain-containing histidine kinase [Prevotella sp.]|nr:HAMP domain-containing histidine kinase [Prevotella sp.]
MNRNKFQGWSLRIALFLATIALPTASFAADNVLEQVFDLDHCVAYGVAIMLIAIFVLLFLNFVYAFHEQDASLSIRDMNDRMSLILKTGNQQLWIYKPSNRHYYTITEQGTYGAEYNPVEFSQFFDRGDFDKLQSSIFDMCDGKRSSAVVNIRGAQKEDSSVCHYEISVVVAERDSEGRLKLVLGIQRDVTEEHMRRQHVQELMVRYHTVFNTSLIDMLFYDKNGVLKEINQKACETFHVSDQKEVLDGSFLLENNPMFNRIPLETIENTRSSSIIDFADFQADKYRLEDFQLNGKMYYESTINPIRGAGGQLEGVYMAGRDITEMVESYHRQKEGALRLFRKTQEIKDYIRNINYALRVSDVRLVNYYPSSFRFEISDDISESQLRMSQLRCIRLAAPRFRRTVSSVLNRMDHGVTRQIEANIETEIRDKKGRPIWLLFNLVPIISADGKVERYFGLCRNMTDLVETEQRLAVETRKAQETERLKQSFLTNMSYEIRTPLNTVVGFADLFETEHDVADEAVFVEEIKRNANTMLQLVNDVLFISRLDANMVEYPLAEVDFALLFESHCQMGWSNKNPDVTTIADNPYQRLMVEINFEYLGQVIERLCALSVHFAPHGTIKAKCEYRRGELTITVEDTGVGIDEKTLPHVFDRFVRNAKDEMCGTGLDLPIIQLMVQQMGGTIELQSELGKGTTVWVTIPCKASVIEKRTTIV